MTREEFNHICEHLGPTTYVCQWGGSDVWKIGGKVFVIGSLQKNGIYAMSFKVTPVGYEILKDADMCQPAPYLASRGMTWIMAYAEGGLDDAQLRDHLRHSYELIARALPKKTKASLGII